jgi:hypothetical protein
MTIARRKHYLEEARKLSDGDIAEWIAGRPCACLGKLHQDDPECYCRMMIAAVQRVRRERHE